MHSFNGNNLNLVHHLYSLDELVQPPGEAVKEPPGLHLPLQLPLQKKLEPVKIWPGELALPEAEVGQGILVVAGLFVGGAGGAYRHPGSLRLKVSRWYYYKHFRQCQVFSLFIL